MKRVHAYFFVPMSLALLACASSVDEQPTDAASESDLSSRRRAPRAVVDHGEVAEVTLAVDGCTVYVEGDADGAPLLSTCSKPPDPSDRTWILRQMFGVHERTVADWDGSAYKLVVLHSAKCVAVEGASSAAGARLVQETCVPGAPEQTFYFGPSDSPYDTSAILGASYLLRPSYVRMCVTSAASIVLSSCANRWTNVHLGDLAPHRDYLDPRPWQADLRYAPTGPAF